MLPELEIVAVRQKPIDPRTVFSGRSSGWSDLAFLERVLDAV
ncbi:MAG: hypothetical protein ACFB2Z_05065 [Maricaulaceae bacterium]